MKNKEFYKEDIFNIAIQGYAIALSEGKPICCKTSNCSICSWAFHDDCFDGRREWLDEEHVEDPFDLEEGDRFYYINALGKVQVGIYGKSNTHYVKVGNACKDPDVMNTRVIELRNYNKLANLAIKCNQGWEPNWDDQHEYKWFIVFDHLLRKMLPNYTTHIYNPTTIYFKSKEDVVKAIKTLEE